MVDTHGSPITVALIPLRGGSKSIPLKNIQPLAGRPLAYWTIKAVLDTKKIDRVFVASDSKEILEKLEGLGWTEDERKRLELIDRKPENATDTASTESVMLEFASQRKFENIVLIQATSPLLRSKDLSEGLEKFATGKFDSLLSAVKQKRFFWAEDSKGARPLNYDFSKRPRRQDFIGQWVENGAFYVTSREALLKSSNRLSGRIGLVEMPEETYFEIDEPSDWKIVEGFLRSRKTEGLKEKLSRIKLVVTDVDGVLTDAGMYYSERGDEMKRFHTRDGKGFELLRMAEFSTAIMTQENTEMVSRRANKLKVLFPFPGVQNKLEQMNTLLKEKGWSFENVLYIGDDLNDLEVMKAVGVACCPRDASPIIRDHATYICDRRGGRGCFREVADLLLSNFKGR